MGVTCNKRTSYDQKCVHVNQTNTNMHENMEKQILIFDHLIFEALALLGSTRERENWAPNPLDGKWMSVSTEQSVLPQF